MDKEAARKARHNIVSKAYRQKHPEKVAAARKRWKVKNGWNAKFHMYRVSARHKGRTWELTKAEFKFLIESNCFYCGVKGEVGIDRYKNNIGYTKTNCVPCCIGCNRSKLNGSALEYVKRCMQVAELWKNK